MKKEPGKIYIKSQDDGSITLAGYGVVFGGRDLEGDYFDKNTDFMMDLVPVKPITYNHTKNISDLVPSQFQEMAGKLPHIPDPIGLVSNKNISMDDVGIWIEATIETSKEYLEYVKEIAKRGLIGLSSSTAPAFVTSDRQGKITRWPIVEFAVTPIPAEPRTLGVQQIKSLFDAAGLEMPETFNEAERQKVAEESEREAERAQLKARIFLLEE
jgi:hypothetical protein